MKAIKIGYDEFYTYPEGVSGIEAFADYLNKHYHSFVALTCLRMESCTYPYFIKGDTVQIYTNVSQIRMFEEVDVTILEREEYDRRLRQVVKEKCVHCANYKEHTDGDDLKGHRERISLDGECDWFTELEKE